jgi:excinuclease ABC subunit A
LVACGEEFVMGHRPIQLRGVRVHNLKGIDLDLPSQRLVAFCGVSGSGKTSLAFDTLYAEGQRRYIESFSAYTRQFLEQLEKPAAEHIAAIPPAIAVTHQDPTPSSRATVGTATEVDDYLRLLFAKVGRIFCFGCGREIRRESANSVARQLQTDLPLGKRFQIAFPRSCASPPDWDAAQVELRENGFVRAIIAGRTVDLARPTPLPENVVAQTWAQGPVEYLVVVDRLSATEVPPPRLLDSLETAFDRGDGRCRILIEQPASGETRPSDGSASRPAAASSAAKTIATEHRSSDQRDLSGARITARRTLATEGPPGDSTAVQAADVLVVDGRSWEVRSYNRSLCCEPCGISYPELDPRLFSFNSALGACPACEGFGNQVEIDMDLVIPDPRKTLREGAIAPWNTPSYRHELEELLALAPDYGLPIDVPYAELSDEQRQLIREGVPARSFGGLNGFFAWLERRKYKLPIRVFLSRWRSYVPCPTCHGARLRPEARAVRVGGPQGRDMADLYEAKITDTLRFFREVTWSPMEHQIARGMLEQVLARLEFLERVGLGYLQLNRPLRTLSGGEAQRVSLTSAMGSSLVDMLYVLDEPSVGLHPSDVHRLIQSVESLRDRGNTVVVVEHEEAMLRAADYLVEIGPGAGEQGGQIVFQGTLDQMLASSHSLTGDFLAGRRGVALPNQRRAPQRGWVRLTGARGNNLRNLTVEFPLGVLCLVTGVSGAGKSTLVQDTLYGALCRRKRKETSEPLPYDDVIGAGQIDDVILIDQSPIGRSPRSNPVTYVKAFDEIRAVFAETIEARTHNYGAGHFSFNVDGGRCDKCKGDGYLAVDMQFLADVFMKCDECGGTRYRPEILHVQYRQRNIAEVLEMTVRQAFAFFRGQTKVQDKLRRLIDVGLDYLRLGQPANTLSAGEAQRLKLATYIATARRHRTLFIMDEPTTGLHYADIVQLLDCFDMLLSAGHSLVIVEHNLQMIKAADYIIDLGPGPAEAGGQVVIQGTPEQIAACPASITGHFLRDALGTN